MTKSFYAWFQRQLGRRERKEMHSRSLTSSPFFFPVWGEQGVATMWWGLGEHMIKWATSSGVWLWLHCVKQGEYLGEPPWLLTAPSLSISFTFSCHLLLSPAILSGSCPSVFGVLWVFLIPVTLLCLLSPSSPVGSDGWQPWWLHGPCRRWDCQDQGLGWPFRQAPAAWWSVGYSRSCFRPEGKMGPYGVMAGGKKPWLTYLFMYLLPLNSHGISPSSGQEFPFLASGFLLAHISLSVLPPPGSLLVLQPGLDFEPAQTLAL